ncbi:transposase [Catenibacterium sp. co_0103]|uniref:transposase n=1 Tax=Catenibacterium sp. co_0103 TaxID=2478954 RepID=UPI0024785D20|nr:transposase [Catenibacterium sp. co_0103]
MEFFKSMKWPEGFSCDRCGCHKYYLVKRVGKTKTSYVLNASCHKQHSLLSGTIFQVQESYKLLLVFPFL